MTWIYYLLAAIVLPPIFVLAPPWRKLSPRWARVRLAASVIAVWFIAILWSVRGTIRDNPPDAVQVHERNFAEHPRIIEEEDNGDTGDAEPIPQAPRPGKRGIAATKPVKPANRIAKAQRRKKSNDAIPQASTQPSQAEQRGGDGDKDIGWDWTFNAPTDTGFMLLLGWIPGLVYAGLLFLARKGFEKPGVQVVDDLMDPRRFYR